MKLKKCMRDYPIPACIGVAAVSFAGGCQFSTKAAAGERVY